ncbi:MAG TPA: hypothetical protein VHB68_16545, partial [Steroidobacteraceae bacterium]|nr:hypothetical protein [Steroidobacteraceae bacterium]
YSAASVPFHGLAVLEELSGEVTQVVDPFQAVIDSMGQQELQPHQRAAVERAGEVLDEAPWT